MKKSFKDYLKLGITVAVTAIMCAMTASSVFADTVTFDESKATPFDLTVNASSYVSNSTYKWKIMTRSAESPNKTGYSTYIYKKNGDEYKTMYTIKTAGTCSPSDGSRSVYFKVDKPSKLVYSFANANNTDSNIINLYTASDLTTTDNGASYTWVMTYKQSLASLNNTSGAGKEKQGYVELTPGEYAIGSETDSGSFWIYFLGLEPIDSITPTYNTDVAYQSKDFGTASYSAEQYATYPKLEGSGTNYSVKLDRNFKEGCVISEVGVILADNASAGYGKGYKLKYYSKSGTEETGTYNFTVQTTAAPKKIQAYITYKLGDNAAKTVYSNIIQ
ncbi:MAG: hypothetical protein IJ583_17735 [Firmicutes bacterium]|nr:hypothetical protein [Bacillota bacterium]